MASSNGGKKMNSDNCIQQASYAGMKSAAVACVVSTVATLGAVRHFPWAKAALNHTGQALVISGASIASYFIGADKAVLEGTRENARDRYVRS